MKSLLGENNFSHSEAQKTGVLLVQLGTPAAPTSRALWKYLKEFLGDSRVVEAPRLIWFFSLHFLILPRRTTASAKRYKSIWTTEGSPLLTNTQKIMQKLKLKFEQNKSFVFALGMRYGSPSIKTALRELKQKNCRYLLVLPMYPQYASATTASVFSAVTNELQSWRWIPDLKFLNQYHDHSNYIQALARSIRAHWDRKGQGERLIFSYHGTPLQSLFKGDPYHCQCHKTSRLVAQELKLSQKDYLVCFQSRLGRKPWLQPYTDHVLKSLPTSGIRSVDLICPGFSVDCLETLEEIGVENRKIFMQARGKNYNYISCLNDSPDQIALYENLIQQHTQSRKLTEDRQLQAIQYTKLKQKYHFYDSS